MKFVTYNCNVWKRSEPGVNLILFYHFYSEYFMPRLNSPSDCRASIAFWLGADAEEI